MQFNILVIKESRAAEARVGLVPADVMQCIKLGHQISIESNAGVLAGFSNNDYVLAGATILDMIDLKDYYVQLFKKINLIVRVKRAEPQREIAECASINPHTIMVGALDPLEKNSTHLELYNRTKIISYSLDQLQLMNDDPLNILASMSKIAGKLALLDALAKFKFSAKKVILVGFGIIGQAAFAEAIKQNLKICVILNDKNKLKEILDQGAEAIILNKLDLIEYQQNLIKQQLSDADLVITSARTANQVAPILISENSLAIMRSGSVIIDMAISEGGNVIGSKHDSTIITKNGVLISNVSGYPKIVPHEASILWSAASLKFIELLTADINHPNLSTALCNSCYAQ